MAVAPTPAGQAMAGPVFCLKLRMRNADYRL